MLGRHGREASASPRAYFEIQFPDSQMARGNDAARRIFFRYIVTNVLILVLPTLLAITYYSISLRVIQRHVDTIAISQLSSSMNGIEKLLADIQNMSIQLSIDYEVNYYLSSQGSFSGIEYYNLKRISKKLAPYVFGNAILGHCFLYLEKSGFLIFESGFSAYENFYGVLFSVQGYTADRWREAILRSSGGESFFPLQTVWMGGQESESHIYRRAIGYGGYYLGSIVGIIDQKLMNEMLADLPKKYGGWVLVQDTQGRIICSTEPDINQAEKIRDAAAGSDILHYDGETYRLYRMKSTFNGWEYSALLSETKVLAAVKTVRDIALLLLGGGFLIGIGASYFFAFRNSRPLHRLINLILPDQVKSLGRRLSVYEQVERAIAVMSKNNKQLQHTVRSTAKITRTYFFQNLLRGNYRTREAFSDERRLFRIELTGGPYYVILCRLAALNAAGEDESFSLLRKALLEAAERRIGARDFLVPVSFDDVVIVKHRDAGRVFRTEAESLIEGIRSDIDAKIRGDFLFGIGEPTADPFLLIISYNQAVTAVSYLSAAGQEAFLFYEELPKAKGSYFYPLDIEAGIVRAVHSANRELLDSLIRTIKTANFAVRSLSLIDIRNLYIELQGTVLKLLNDLPHEDRAIRMALQKWGEKPQAPENLDELAAIFLALMGSYDLGKKSHNTALLEALQAYIEDNYARSELGLTLIADTFRRSENYLSNFFKEQTGECLSAAIQRVRFREAVRLLLETEEPIDTVAVKCGYLNTSSFRRAFKRLYGWSPSEYKMNRTKGGTRQPSVAWLPTNGGNGRGSA